MVLKSLAGLSLALGLVVLLGAAGFYRAHRENLDVTQTRILTGDTDLTLDLRPEVYADLPAPVRRYFDYAFNGRDSITLSGVEWDQSGPFLLPAVGRFHADGHQVSRPAMPVYAFTGWFRRYGLPLIESRDAFFVDGHDMRAKLLGWLKVMHTDYEDPEDIASLHSYLVLRYYGQAPVMPWALLPNEFVEWQANDRTSAYLSVTRPGLAGRYLVRFGEDGEIASMDGDRPLMEGNGSMQREVGRKTGYQEINGFMVPTRLDYRWFDESAQMISRFQSEITGLRIIRSEGR